MSASTTTGLIDMATLERVAPVIRLTAHPLRLRIIDYLRREGGPRCVTDIGEALGSDQSVTSQQLRILRDQGVLAARRDGCHVFYNIMDPSVLLLLDCIREHHCCGSLNDPDAARSAAQTAH
jgi:ArsR family transcriptional regulator